MNAPHTDAVETHQEAGGSLILTVTKSGAISSVVEARQELRQQFEDDPESISVDGLWREECVDRIRASLRRALRNRTSCAFEMECADGATEEFIVVPRGADRLLMIVRDLTEQKRAHEQAHRLAYTDDVTGLPNRVYLFDELRKVIEVQRLKEGRSAVICIHVGHFDDYGYALSAGQQDEVLAQLASRMRRQLRKTNQSETADFERFSIVSRSDYRQFCVVLPSIETGEDAEAVAERLVDALRLPINLRTRSVNINASSGISLYPQDGTDAVSLFENAIAAMEDARCESGAAIKFHSGTVRLRSLQRSDLEAELKAALDNGDYDLNYLPTVDIESGVPRTMEALLRWPDTVLGSQPTRKIVRVAERTGIIVPIGRWVLRHACEQLRRWRDEGHADVRVAVNMSAQEMVSDGMIESLQQALSETGVDPADLDVELKESLLAREALKGFDVCKRLRDLGVRLVVDDFGAGSCSLAHFAQGRIEAIKIDRSIVEGLDKNEHSVATIAAALAMAEQLGIDAIAEGVETENQLEILQAHGCRYVQGFLLGEPMDANAALEYLNTDSAGRARAKGGIDGV
ncbi:MAG: bifunctional diguanylate cyclase/phosphodiesterase [Gammaproteobacteria bacterium]|nr:bifunctional diguanylate cyclase/phosphodiesterase [Gammaproteobacteria bacterium]MBT8095149.1 bifunctional diguanylate cyclase/phosphodiesterase [Gammaproteobacteria bacterium]MBT8106190.1 bifunctional diguanylate cyclase/phosphodiesterase [Gammaproteobacteria bacterium]NNF49207.1 GGDEF domain-containing protein [Woeseiaceae bacterium]NNK26204.1 GGDEF domain-containing protein [Woeseiaceae bacterium]